MKTNNQGTNSPSSKPNPKVSQSGGKRMENKDNLDHRGNEEQEFKGDDSTHNTKETKKDHLKKKEDSK